MTTEDMQDMVFAAKMENYIKSKGYQPIGPLVQYTGAQQNENGEPELVICMLRQANGFINHTEPPYIMESVLRVQVLSFGVRKPTKLMKLLPMER